MRTIGILLYCVIALVLSACDAQIEGKDSSNKETGSWGYEFIDSGNQREGGKPIKIAVLDSGINSSLPELKDRVIKSFDVIENDEVTKDSFDHGTSVAAIIGGERINNEIQGINQHSILYDVQVLNENGLGDISTVVDGIEWCIKEKVDVINISFGFEKNYPELEGVIHKALDEGIIIVAASGNTLGLNVEYPAKYQGVISVASINKDSKRSSVSAKGKIDYAAPGEDVLSINNQGQIGLWKGTSFAAPMLTGVISVLMSQSDEDITYKNIHNFLKPYVQDLGEKGHDEEFGNGVIKLR